MSTKRLVARTRNWPAWVGEREDLDRLIEIAIEAERSIAEPIIENHKSHDKEKYCPCDTYLRECKAKLWFTEGGDKVSGTPSDVVSEIDYRTLISIGIKLRVLVPELYELELVMQSSNHWNSGASLTVSSNNQHWARQTFAAFSEEVSKGIPWWSIFRRVPVNFVVSMLVVAIMMAFMIPAIRAVPDDKYTPFAALASLGVTAMGYLIYYTIARWIFRPFELIPNGAQSKGGRRIIFIAGILISIPTGILVNYLSLGSRFLPFSHLADK